MTTSGYGLITAPVPAQRLVHIHPGAEELGRVYQADLMINATMPAATQALAALPRVTGDARGRMRRQRSERGLSRVAGAQGSAG